eukprot:g5980.t1
MSRSLQGFGAALSSTVCLALLADSTPKSKHGSVMALAEMASASGWTLGPALGGVIFVFVGWLGPFLILAVSPVLMLVFVLFFFPTIQTRREKDNEDDQILNGSDHFHLNITRLSTTSLLRIMISWDLVLMATAGACMSGAWGQWDLGFTPWIKEEFHYTESQCGIIFSIPPLFYMLFSLPAGRAADRFDRKFVTSFGLFLSAIAFFTSAGFFATFWPWVHLESVVDRNIRLALLYIGLVLIGVGGPFAICGILPEMLCLANENLSRYFNVGDTNESANKERISNLVSGLFTAFFNIGGGIGPLLGAIIEPSFGYRVACCFSTFACLTIALLLVVGVKCKKPTRESDYSFSHIQVPISEHGRLDEVAVNLEISSSIN